MKIATVYAIVGTLWIIGSGWLLHGLVEDHAREVRLENVKGWFFVAVTATLLGLTLDHFFKRIRHSAELLQESGERLRLAAEAARMGTFDCDLVHDRVVWSARHEQIWGLQPGRFEGNYQAFLRQVHPDDVAIIQAEWQRCTPDRPNFHREFRVVWPDTSVHWIASAGEFTFDADGRPVRLRGTVTEVTERKQAERLQALSLEVLGILNDPRALGHATRRILTAVKRETGLDAVGIRLREGEDFPYAAAEGFSPSFLEAENSLAMRGDAGEFCRDEQGRLRLECTCGLVLTGQTDPANPLFTAGGSAWTNDARPFLQLPREADPRTNPRNRCIHEGFQSVALIPVRVKDAIIGLLQLNDRRKGCFTLEMVRVLEGIAASLGVALLRLREENALRQSENTLRSLFDAIPESVFLMDLDGTLLAANATFATRLKCRPEDCIGQSVFGFLSEETATRRRGWIEEVVRARGPVVQEDQRDGRWLRHSLCPVRGEDGEVRRIVVFAMDFTEQRLANAALRRWADAFEHCAHGIALGIPDVNTVLVCNPALARMLGSSPEEVAGSKILNLYAPEDHDAVRRHIAEADRSGQVRYEAHMVRKDGIRFPVQMDVVSVRDAQGRTLYRVATAQDVTERRHAMFLLHQRIELQDQLTKIAVTVPGMICSFLLKPDGAASMPFATPAIADLYGLRPDEVRRDFTPILDRVHPEDREPLMQGIRESARTMRPWQDVFRARHPQKGELWLEGHSVPRREPDGSILWHGFVQDVTDRRKAEQALRERNEELVRFVYTVSHDLKSPLVTIRTFLGYLEKDLQKPDPGRVADDLKFIGRAALKMSDLLDELLELSRIGRKTNPPEDVPLQTLVQEALSLVAGAVSQRQVAVQVTDVPVLLHGDRRRLLEVFQNLLDNAVKFMGGQTSPRIEVGVEDVGRELVLYVRDNGVGIDPRHRGKLFGLFEKLHPETPGTGIGLALVKRIVEIHGGRIWADSDGPGQGATFRFTLADSKRL